MEPFVAMDPAMEEITDRAADRLAEMVQRYHGTGRECTKCKTWKVWSAFGKSKTGKNGRHAECKVCQVRRKRDIRRGVRAPARERPASMVCRGACARELPFDIEHFEKKARNRWGLTLDCRECRNAAHALVERLKRRHPKEEAGGRCSTCDKETDDLVIDHDHDTDEFRGWVCRSCNSQLAFPFSHA